MDKHHDPEQELIHDGAPADPLAQVYEQQLSPDIAAINEHAAALEEEAAIEPDSL